jgi:hypothetical protein
LSAEITENYDRSRQALPKLYPIKFTPLARSLQARNLKGGLMSGNGLARQRPGRGYTQLGIHLNTLPAEELVPPV